MNAKYLVFPEVSNCSISVRHKSLDVELEFRFHGVE